MSYKVVIPSAGLGSRVGPYSKFMNKALITIGEKPAISRVIDKFSESVPIVVLLGYRGDMVREVLECIYPKRDITFVEVDNYDGVGSGLGYSLLKAEKFLQNPFIFIPNDTIIGKDLIDLDPETEGNWAAYYKKQKSDGYDTEIFRTLTIDDNNYVANFTGKGTSNSLIYIGICGIKNYKKFWDNLNDPNALRVGEVFGLKFLEKVKAIQIRDWYDCGSLNNLERAKKHFANKNFNILEKEDESIWFCENDVIKFSVDQSFIRDRVKRIDFLPKNMIPEVKKFGKFTYKYIKEKGNVISEKLSVNALEQLLNIAHENLWSKTGEIDEISKEHCYDFYKRKTSDRVNKYLQRFEEVDSVKVINEKKIDSVKNLLSKVNWKEICESPKWALFHGDFHAENIIFSKKKNFVLLDWRQNFGKDNFQYGDTYYDLAKLNHGFIVNHGVVTKNLFKIKEIKKNHFNFSIHQLSNLMECREFLKDWSKDYDYDFNRIELITALIFLNIAGLHDFPYSKFLFHLGQHKLSDSLKI